MNKYDWKYILKRILVGVSLFIILSFIKSCNVKAYSIDYTDWLTIDGYHLPAWWQLSQNSGSYRSLLFKTSQDPNSPEASDTGFGYLDICSNYNFKVSNPSATCNDGCFYNTFNVYNIGQSCVIDADGYLINGSRYFVFFSVKTWTENGIIYDYLKFEKVDTPYGRIQFNGIVFSTEDLYTNYASQNRTNELLEAMNTQLHQDNVNIQNSINSQTQTQHNDSVAEQNAINNNTGAINDLNDDITDDNVSGAESSVDSLLNNSAFTDSSGVNAIISLPLNFIQSLTSKSCKSLLINIPYMNEVVTVPCMQNYIHTNAPTLYLIIKTLVNGYVIYRVLLDILSMVKSARNPDDDRIEVLDL